MDERYDSYCAADPLFYDSLGSVTTQPGFPTAARPLPEGWQSEPTGDWLIYAPVDGTLPEQGWKIHVSATLTNADEVLAAVWDYCVPRGLAFKFLRGPRTLLMRNSKYAARGASGKFVTVYPRDEAELELTCKELDELLAGQDGPYILSDLRYHAGPVYVRYGGFAARYCQSDEGQVVPAIADDSGTLVPDRRDPVFHVPSWVTLPDFLAPHLAARNGSRTDELPYRIEKVIHFSNGGGLYVGRDLRSDTQVVLKEARPHAGLDADGADAVARLHREADNLRRLADLPQVPRVHDEFVFSDHHFLALEFIEGRALNKEIVERYPLIDADATDADRATYADWARSVHAQVETVIEEIHARGLVYGDLHLFNVMIRPDDTVALVDFEVAAPIDGHRRPGLRNQGFAAPRDRTGPAVDRYALACLRLALFLPLTQLVRLETTKAAQLADVIAEAFPVSRDWLTPAVQEITGSPATSEAAPVTGMTAPDYRPHRWDALRACLASALLTSATPQRDERLFPGDIEQFRSGGLNLAHGAAGVLHALAVSGAGQWPEHEQWLLRRATSPVSGTRCGFYDGLHGVAYALDGLGRRQGALDVLDICLRQPWQDLDHSLRGGLAGIGLNLLHLAERTGETRLREEAWRVAERLVEQVAVDPGGEISGGRNPYAGLLRGRTGPALLLLRLYEASGDRTLLAHAATALRQDLRRCVVRPDGALEVNEGWRTMPYLAEGSVGIGLVLERYLRHQDDEQFRTATVGIRRAARSPFYAQTGLFAGRAGIIAYLAATSTAGDEPDALPAQVRRLAWHALPYADGVAFPGEQLLRLSMDLATGTAGVLLAVAAAHGEAAAGLPFLAPAPGAPRLPRRSGGDQTDPTTEGR
ncbi:class III lanthionine synthetase LanKC [Micromonospora yangpuensis]|uniref:non-specific serine/threonine protein kinase n=1 Tax=Micromonospora yangpuensis TaxID=683228 RepID=A0A1C6UTE2_9ACTN|nr:class III lanthionine synthetase LanKC [Micromonospora yangpuensis]GGM24821.1 serine/threonine protein kinase [Micromonospora yangpuensis]SCL57324.1 Protein kinase domain-containing protein [Micromonospora yangpuensis]